MSNNATQYLVVLNGETVATKGNKQSAIRAAEAVASEHPAETVEVQTSGGKVVHTIEASQGKRGFKPWTRTETHEGMEVEVPEGYVVAYTRKRVGAVVARSEAKDGWMVITVAGDQVEAANTKEAREITNQLAADHRAQREADKKAEAERKAQAKKDREAAREQARKDKEAAKAAKASKAEETEEVAS